MNPNPYPQGRWTPRRRSGCSGPGRESESIQSLRQAPLRELFWGHPESSLLDEARQRIESALLAALLAPSPESPVATELEQQPVLA